MNGWNFLSIGMEKMDVEIVQLNDGRWVIVVEGRSETFGPFKERELRAILHALDEWTDEVY